MNLPLTLRHYRVFISYCSPSKKKSRADILEMENLVKIIRASFHGAKITTQTVDAQAFIEIVGGKPASSRWRRWRAAGCWDICWRNCWD
nr:TraC family protein [Escherichia coli]